MWSRSRQASWGSDMVAAARKRSEPKTPCASCGVKNPTRFARCQTCRGPTKRAQLPSHQRCGECDEWNDGASHFCALCGAPMAAMGDPATWRPDGCPGCWGDLVGQPGLKYCGTCGASLPASLLERRELLSSVAARRVGESRGGYRDRQHRPRLHEARCELVIRDDESVVWLALKDSEIGVVELEFVGEASQADQPPPATPGPLAELVGWVRQRLIEEDRVANAAIAQRAETFREEGERVTRARRVGPLVQVRVACSSSPKPGRVDAWLDQLAEWALLEETTQQA